MLAKNDTCEVKVGAIWVAVTLDKALALHPDRIKRCVECHGGVRAHKTAVNGMQPHFEHFDAHPGCSRSRSVKFSGISRLHPRAVS